MDIGGWLRGLGLERYEQAFRENEIDEEVLPGLTADDLKDLGVALVGHRRRLLDAIAALAAAPPAPMPYINHYSFHIADPDWGHLTIKISGHPPFPAQVMLNGHEYVACQARKAGITFTKEGNCFTSISDAAGLAKIADTLSDHRAIGRLSQVCERWIYACVCFALDFDEQKRSGFRYQYSNYQIEYSRNLVFQVGAHMDQVFQALIDRSRAPLAELVQASQTSSNASACCVRCPASAPRSPIPCWPCCPNSGR
jgi:hypothetical protein